MSLSPGNKTFNNYNISSNMRKEKVDKYDNAKFNHNKNVKMKSDRLHFIANKSKGENAMLAKKIVELYDT